MRRGKTADLDDEALLDTVQRQTLRYFWNFGHPTSGLARERSNATPPMSRHYRRLRLRHHGDHRRRRARLDRPRRGCRAPVDDGALSAEGPPLSRRLSALYRRRHRRDGSVQPQDDGGDLVETSFLFAGLLCARQYFDARDEPKPAARRHRPLWEEAEWNWYTQGGRNVLFWHWSPTMAGA